MTTEAIRAENVEATAGFGPANRGFADLPPYSPGALVEYERRRSDTMEREARSSAFGSAVRLRPDVIFTRLPSCETCGAPRAERVDEPVRFPESKPKWRAL